MKRTPRPKPENPPSAMFRRYSKPICALLTAAVLVVSISLIAQSLLAQRALAPSQSPEPQSAPINQTSPSSSQVSQSAEEEAPSTTESPTPSGSSEAQITPQPTPNASTAIRYPRTVRTSYTPLPQPKPEEGIAIVSVTYYSAGDTLMSRFIESMVTNVTVMNFGQDYLTATTISMIPNSQTKTISAAIPPNSTVDIPTVLFPRRWNTGMRFYVVVTTAEGYSAASSEFEFPISDY
jgi:cytoskeletal protein RodZ